METTRTPEQRAADQRTFLRDFARLLVLPVLAFAALLLWWHPWKLSYYTPPSGTDIYALLTGSWDWSTAEDSTFCLTSHHTIGFSPDRRVMSITQAEPWTDDDGVERQVSVYEITEIDRGRLRGRIRGERRVTEAGEPVVWDLVMLSPASYTWHRTDWWPASTTKAINRCPATTPAALAAPGT